MKRHNKLIENSDGVARQVIRTQGSLEAPSKGWGGGKRGDGDQKLLPRYHGGTAYTHYFKFEVVFLTQKLSASQYISEMLS